jgi:hypothetical protein
VLGHVHAMLRQELIAIGTLTFPQRKVTKEFCFSKTSPLAPLRRRGVTHSNICGRLFFDGGVSQFLPLSSRKAVFSFREKKNTVVYRPEAL